MKKLLVAVLFGLFLSTSVNAEEDTISRSPSLEQILAGQVKYGIKLDEAPALIDCFQKELARHLRVSVVGNSGFNNVLSVWLGIREPQTFNDLKGREFFNTTLRPEVSGSCRLAFDYYNANITSTD